MTYKNLSEFPLEYDDKIRTTLEKLSLEELAHIAQVSGVMFYSGYLNRGEENDREII